MTEKKVLPVNQKLFEYKSYLKQLLGLTAILNILMLTPSIYMLQIYDRVLSSYNLVTLVSLTVIVLFLYLVIAYIEHLRSKVVILLSQDFDGSLSGQLFSRLLRDRSGKTSVGIQDLASIKNFISGQSLFGFLDGPWAPIYLIVIFLFNFWMGIFSLIAMLILIAMAFLNDRLTKSKLNEASSAKGDSLGFFSEMLRSKESVSAMGMVPNLFNHWSIGNNKYLVAHSDASESGAKISALTKFVRLSVQSMILGLGAWLVITEDITPGMMIAGSILLSKALSPIEAIIASWKQWDSTKRSIQKINDFLVIDEKEVPNIHLGKIDGDISCENASVVLGSDKKLLSNINFKIPAGSHVALIGPSGAGKTTLLKMLAGIINPSQGVVRYGGASINQWDPDVFGSDMGFMPQEIQLIRGSIASNIARFGKIDSEEVQRVARLSGSDEFVLRLKDGFDTQLSDGGLGLSQGQNQRLLLARALYASPSVIFFDEPTSAQDEIGIKQFSKALLDLKSSGKTVVYSTHQKDLVLQADLIILMVAGEVKLYGPRAEVLAQLQNTNRDS
jgi:ATP-binding cassette, subfamily C, bacterial exporter for protease/lipase